MTVLTVGVVGAVVVTGGAAIVATPALAGSATGAGFATVAGVGGAAATVAHTIHLCVCARNLSRSEIRHACV